jgi:hypothetical protein
MMDEAALRGFPRLAGTSSEDDAAGRGVSGGDLRGLGCVS